MRNDAQEFDVGAEAGLPVGLSVIEASAGTGKTFAISHLVPRLLLDGTVGHIGEVLLVTYTKAAAGELAHRVRTVLARLAAEPAPDEAAEAPLLHRLRQRFGEPRHRAILARGLVEIDRLQVSTIHAFCQRTLQVEGAACGWPVSPEIATDTSELLDAVVFDLWRERIAGDEWLAEIATALGWSPADDREFVRRALALDHPESEPAPRALTAAVAELRDLVKRFAGGPAAALHDFCARVPKWKKGSDDPAIRAGHCRALEAGTPFGKVHAAATWVASFAGEKSPIAVQSAAGKACRGEVASLEAVELAARLIAAADLLRWHWQHEMLVEARRRVEAELRATRQVSYDGLVAAVRDALAGPTGPDLARRLRATYRVGLIDESQDTDARQFEIFRRIFVGGDEEAPLRDHRLVLIGDPKQAIYAFRGADVNTYLSARERAGDKVFRLTRTFRAPEPLVRAVNAFFDRPGSLLKEGLEFVPAVSGLDSEMTLHLGGAPVDGRVEAWLVPEEAAALFSRKSERLDRVAGMVATRIVELLDRGELVNGERRPVRPADIAVLVNKHEEGTAVAEALRRRRVPAIKGQGADVLQTEEAEELLAVLRALVEPRRAALRRAALATRLLGWNAEQLRHDAENDAALEAFTRWRATLERQGIAAVLAEIDSEQGVSTRVASLPDGERRLTNVRQIIDLMQAAALNECRRPEHLRRWFAREMRRAQGRSDVEERQLQLERDDAAVQIVTMHGAKGLEYPLVFCPFLWSSTAPSGVQVLLRKDRVPLLVDLDRCRDESVLAEVRRTALEDRVRLAYVALTRAQVRAWVLAGEVGGTRTPASALDWLLRDDEDQHGPGWCAEAARSGRGSRHGMALRAFATNTNGLVVVDAPPEPNDVVWSPPPPLAESLVTLPLPTVPTPWAVTSFSGLTREKNPHGGTETRIVPAGAVAPELPANAFTPAPGGALVGTAIHEWIERWDFGELDVEKLRAHLAGYRLATGADWGRAIGEMLTELRDTRLPGLRANVAAACPDAAASEWRFHLPIAGALSPARLAEAFASEPAYARAVAALPASAIAGYLQGFLDRVAFFDGAWGVIDWKTNRLDAYDEDSVRQCARQSHYWLQTHLYLVALRRFLGPGVPIAGAWLIFLRGVRRGTADGVLAVCPQDDVLSRLDALFA